MKAAAQRCSVPCAGDGGAAAFDGGATAQGCDARDVRHMRRVLVPLLAACTHASSPHGTAPDAAGDAAAVVDGASGDAATAQASAWRAQVLYLVIPDRFRNGDPTNDNATGYLGQLRALDADVAKEIATLPADDRKVVTNHDAFLDARAVEELRSDEDARNFTAMTRNWIVKSGRENH